ncbi:hypothetical protein J132_04728 [Termitomyces sp. J132]|nr:hypothetical protein J132_04728 [Termitomyces sp. J132]
MPSALTLILYCPTTPFAPSPVLVSSVTLSAQSSCAATATTVTLSSLVIREKDPKDKGKGKATEEEEMEIDAANVPLPKDDFMDKELQNLLKSPKAPTKKAD